MRTTICCTCVKASNSMHLHLLYQIQHVCSIMWFDAALPSIIHFVIWSDYLPNTFIVCLEPEDKLLFVSLRTNNKNGTVLHGIILYCIQPFEPHQTHWTCTVALYPTVLYSASNIMQEGTGYPALSYIYNIIPLIWCKTWFYAKINTAAEVLMYYA